MSPTCRVPVPADDRPALLERGLRIGLLALQDAGVTVNVDVVRAEFEKLMRQAESVNGKAALALEGTLRANFADGDGRLPRTLEKFLGDRGALKTMVEELFDEKKRDSAIGRIGTMLERYFDGDVPARVPHGTAWPGANFMRVDARMDVAPGVHAVRAIAPAGEVEVMIRPERLRLATGGDTDGADNTFDMTVDDVINYGDSLLVIGKTHGFPLRARMVGGAADGLQPGATLELGWAPGDAHI